MRSTLSLVTGSCTATGAATAASTSTSSASTATCTSSTSHPAPTAGSTTTSLRSPDENRIRSRREWLWKLGNYRLEQWRISRSGRLETGRSTNPLNEGCQRVHRHDQPSHRRDGQDLHPSN